MGPLVFCEPFTCPVPRISSIGFTTITSFTPLCLPTDYLTLDALSQRYSILSHSIQQYYHHHHHHHHVMPPAWISQTLSRHSSLSFIAFGRSLGLHPVSSHSCWMYVRAGRPAFAWPYAGVHRSTSLMSSSLLLQQCPACLVRLTCIVFVMGGKWPYSWCLVGCWRQDLFNIALNIYFYSKISYLYTSSNIFYLYTYPQTSYFYIYSYSNILEFHTYSFLRYYTLVFILILIYHNFILILILKYHTFIFIHFLEYYTYSYSNIL